MWKKKKKIGSKEKQKMNIQFENEKENLSKHL